MNVAKVVALIKAILKQGSIAAIVAATITATTLNTTTIELGAGATDTTLARGGSGVMTVEGGNVTLENRANTFIADQAFTGGANALTVGEVTTADATAGMIAATTTATRTPLVIQGAPSQSVPLFEAQQSTGTVRFSIADTGNTIIGGALRVGGGSGTIGLGHFAAEVSLASNYPINWSNTSGDASATKDTGLARDAAGVAKVTNGSTGFAALKNAENRIVNSTEGGTGSLNFKTAREAHTLTLGATSTTTINLPTNVLIYAVQLCVDTAVTDDAGDDTWSAELNDGAGIGTIATGAAAAKQVKVNKAFVPILTDATTNVVFTPNGGNFSAGVIEVVVYYMDLTSMADAP